MDEGNVKYTPAHAETVRKLCLLVPGITNKQIAEFFDVTERTIANWIGDRPEFREAVHWGRKHADIEVVASMYKNAVGYDTFRSYVNRKGELIREKVYVPGDVKAQIHWLMMRQPDFWRQRPEATPDGGTLAPIGSAEIVEAARRIAFILARAAYQGDVTTVELKEIQHDKPATR